MGTNIAPAWDNRIVEYDPAVPLDQLLAHPRNPKIHPRPQTDALKGILGDVGWLTGLIVNTTTGHVLDGHDRIKAAMEAGQSTAPVFYVSVPEDQEPYILATFDPVGALAATDSTILDDLLREVSSEDSAVQALLASLVTEPEVLPEPGAGGDEFDATPQAGATRVQPGDLWAIGPHRLLCGDCTDAGLLDQLLQGERPALLFADPPYGQAWLSNYYGPNASAPNPLGPLANDDTPHPDLLALWVVALAEAGAAYVCTRWVQCEDWRAWLADQLDVRNIIIWKKNNWSAGDLEGAYAFMYEQVIFATRAGHKLRGARLPDVWEYDRVAPTLHPTMKPVELIERCIEKSTDPNAIVADPTAGAGATLIAAHRQGRIARLMEIEPRYCDVILRRAEAEGIGPIARVAP